VVERTLELHEAAQQAHRSRSSHHRARFSQVPWARVGRLAVCGLLGMSCATALAECLLHACLVFAPLLCMPPQSLPARPRLEEVSRPARPLDIPYAITFWGVVAGSEVACDGGSMRWSI
jgi:hypothetical protein